MEAISSEKLLVRIRLIRVAASALAWRVSACCPHLHVSHLSQAHVLPETQVLMFHSVAADEDSQFSISVGEAHRRLSAWSLTFYAGRE